MTRYILDFDGKEFIKIPFEAKDADDDTNRPEAHIHVGLSLSFVAEDQIDELIKGYNSCLVETLEELRTCGDAENFVMLKCKSCDKWFFFNYGECRWFYNHDHLSIPKRCPKCRRERKEGKK